MRKIDKGTVIRTVLLFVALINQSLIMTGNPVIDSAYLVGSIGFSILTIVIAWWKDNIITDKARKLREKALRSQRLI
ncbi:phage holin [Alkalihalobacillus sp. AL-G]|uniref:phage holin n=1 Tax=Alkalihalobacillus sp. AL-G TaxID=2926399 RepID=UPI00272A7727|nr:phage holin [Alkalihalobacillus sp. AL-G]WLD95459.1 phage holin [Alkalihalobacillus sp. AL-G]